MLKQRILKKRKSETIVALSCVLIPCKIHKNKKYEKKLLNDLGTIHKNHEKTKKAHPSSIIICFMENFENFSSHVIQFDFSC